jgi:hypothetical protein
VELVCKPLPLLALVLRSFEKLKWSPWKSLNTRANSGARAKLPSALDMRFKVFEGVVEVVLQTRTLALFEPLSS